MLWHKSRDTNAFLSPCYPSKFCLTNNAACFSVLLLAFYPLPVWWLCCSQTGSASKAYCYLQYLLTSVFSSRAPDSLFYFVIK